MPKGPHTKYATFQQDPSTDGPPHPRAAAWWGGRVSLSWVSPLMVLGNRKQLSPEDIWGLQHELQSEVVSAKFMAYFDASRSIPRAFVRLFGWSFFTIGVASLVTLLASLVGPMVLNHVVSSLTNVNYSLEDISMWVVVLFVSQVIQALVNNYANFESELIGIELEGSLKSLLYSKTMRLSAQSRMEKSTDDISNMYTSDSDAVYELAFIVHELWTTVLQILIVSYMLYNVLNVAAFAGIGIIVIVLMLNQYVSNKMFGLQRVYRSSKDVRMNKVTEVFKAINIVKYNA